MCLAALTGRTLQDRDLEHWARGCIKVDVGIQVQCFACVHSAVTIASEFDPEDTLAYYDPAVFAAGRR